MQRLTPRVRWLQTVDDVAAEGEQMEHCIASYIPNAVEGRCYLFHVDYQGEAASLMVNQLGQVTQAGGPRNRRNRASAWGRRVLRTWGQRWPDEDPRLQPGPRSSRRQIERAVVEA